jgi:hypothetical protein
MPEMQYLDAVIRRKRGELKIAAKDEVEKSGQQGPQEKSEPEDLPFGRYGLYDENSSCDVRRNKRRNESMKEEQVGKRKVRKAHCRCQSNYPSSEQASLANR